MDSKSHDCDEFARVDGLVPFGDGHGAIRIPHQLGQHSGGSCVKSGLILDYITKFQHFVFFDFFFHLCQFLSSANFRIIAISFVQPSSSLGVSMIKGNP